MSKADFEDSLDNAAYLFFAIVMVMIIGTGVYNFLNQDSSEDIVKSCRQTCSYIDAESFMSFNENKCFCIVSKW